MNLFSVRFIYSKSEQVLVSFKLHNLALLVTLNIKLKKFRITKKKKKMWAFKSVCTLENFNETYLWGPTVRGPGPFALRKSEGPIRGELWPKLYNAKHRTIFGRQPRTV